MMKYMYILTFSFERSFSLISSKAKYMAAYVSITRRAVRNSCERCDNSLRLKIATSPAANCVRMNSWGYRRVMEQISMVMTCVRNAVRESRKTRMIIGSMA